MECWIDPHLHRTAATEAAPLYRFAAFTLDVEQVLAPTLRLGQIVLLDNLSAHNGPQVRAAIEVRLCLWFVPPYAPDFPPIELAFAKLLGSLPQHFAVALASVADTIAVAQACPDMPQLG